jgi:hypothetical protein
MRAACLAALLAACTPAVPASDPGDQGGAPTGGSEP